MRFYSLILAVLFLANPVFAQEWALKQLEDSPRHHEWVEVQSGEERVVHSFVVYPEISENATAVIVIHENRGLTDWVRSFADQLAGAGYLVIAPDLLSQFDQEHQKTGDFATSDDARSALYELDQDQVTDDLLAVREYIANVPASNGKVAVMGFCWGGKQTFNFATNSSDIQAALVFYGSPPDEEGIMRIDAPVYGFYGEDDQRINATIPETEELMEEHDHLYDYEIYAGAGHAFMRHGDDPQGSAANKKARDDAWVRLKNILEKI